MPRKHTKHIGSAFLRRTSAGFTLIELLMILGVIAIIFGVAVPTFVQSQREQNLKSVAQGFESALTALRNLALTGRAITVNGSITEPSGYCMRVLRGAPGEYVIRPFSYVENGDTPDFTPGTGSGNDEASTHSLMPTPIAVPDMIDRYPRIDLLGVLRIDGATITDVYAPAGAGDVAPIVCFAPPKADVSLLASNDGSSLAPATIAYEFGIVNQDMRLRIQVDSVTGRITSTDALEAPLDPTP